MLDREEEYFKIKSFICIELGSNIDKSIIERFIKFFILNLNFNYIKHDKSLFIFKLIRYDG